MDDYYSLIGVEPDAPVDDIRTAYREKKAALDGASDPATAKQLNKAWNVLSDPYQRGRYDEQRTESADDADIDLTDDDEAPSTNGKRPARAERASKGSRQPRELPKPTLTLPAGMHLANRRRRVIAMVIDLFVLLVLYIACTFVGNAIASSQNPGTFSEIDKLTTQVDKQHTATGKANTAADNAEKAKAANAAQLRKAADQAKATEDATRKKLNADTDKVAPTLNLSVGVAFLLGTIYLLVPSLMTGKTLGKRLQHIKVMSEDGSRVRARATITRYGAVIVVTVLLLRLLGPLGVLAPAAVLLGVTRWLSNPNQQGMHDRFAHTIVVDD